MTDDIAYKTIPLPVARLPGKVRGTREERAARVQAHMDRVHPVIDAIVQEEERLQRAVGDPVERSRFNSRKSRRKQRALANLRAAEIAARKRLDAGREVG